MRDAMAMRQRMNWTAYECIVNRRQVIRVRTPTRGVGDLINHFFDLALGRWHVFWFTSLFQVKKALGKKPEWNTYTSLGFPSGPISTLGGTLKFVNRNIWGGIERFMISGREVGRLKGISLCVLHMGPVVLTFRMPERMSSDV